MVVVPDLPHLQVSDWAGVEVEVVAQKLIVLEMVVIEEEAKNLEVEAQVVVEAASYSFEIPPTRGCKCGVGGWL